MSSTIKKPRTDSNKPSSSLMWQFSSNCNFTEWFYNTSESFSEALDHQSLMSTEEKVTIDFLLRIIQHLWGYALAKVG